MNKVYELDQLESTIIDCGRQGADITKLNDIRMLSRREGILRLGDIMTATQCVDALKHIGCNKLLTTTVFYDFLAYSGYGTFDYFYNEDKKRTFQYNKQFNDRFIQEGLVLKGITNCEDKKKLFFTKQFVYVFFESYGDSLNYYTENYKRYIHERDYRK